MPLIYITGIEAAGKSTSTLELKKRGYETYDIDHGIAGYFNKNTGESSDGATDAEKHSPHWHKDNTYMMDRQQVEGYAKQAKDKAIFLCGTTQSDEVVLDLFDKVIYLYLDEETLKQRMARRVEGEFGFAPHEKEVILSWRVSSKDKYRKLGATMIDASLPIQEVVDAILREVKA